MLQDLVAGLARTTAVDKRGARGLLERGSVLTHVDPPHVVQRAGAQAVHALAVVRADDHVGEDRAVFEDEDGVRVSAFGLFAARGCCRC